MKVDYKLNNLNQITTKSDDNWKTYKEHEKNSVLGMYYAKARMKQEIESLLGVKLHL